MKKSILSLMAFAAVSSAFAGGLLTNTNQNAAFDRNFAQEGKIDITSIYANPAGGAFLTNGWHLSLNCQTAFQQRNIETTFPLFQLNTEKPNATHLFEGKATAPLVPSFTVSYNKDKWSISAHFAITGGGGKCEFDNGIGSFEALYSGRLYQQVPAMVNAKLPGQVAAGLVGVGIPEPLASNLASTGTYNSRLTGYGLDAYMKGRSYYFGLQLGATYKFLDNLAGYIGVRGVYATCNYNGYVQDITANYSYDYSVPVPGAVSGASGSGTGTTSLSDYSLSLNCDQTAFGVSPIVGIDWKINKHWNVSAKYEFNTRLNLKNKTEMNHFAQAQAEDPDNALAQFKDGTKVREDAPALLALGVEYSPIEKLRIDAAYHQFFDKASKKYKNKQDLIDHNTHEFILGAEYDICKLITISGSWEITRYGLSDAFMNDLSYSLSNNMVGGGVRINATKRFSIDLGYMCTFYNDRQVTTQTAAGPKTDLYSRKNHTFGIGVNLNL